MSLRITQVDFCNMDSQPSFLTSPRTILLLPTRDISLDWLEVLCVCWSQSVDTTNSSKSAFLFWDVTFIFLSSRIFSKTQVNAIISNDREGQDLERQQQIIAGVYGALRPSESASLRFEDFAQQQPCEGGFEVTLPDDTKTQPGGVHKFIIPDQIIAGAGNPAKKIKQYTHRVVKDCG